MVKTGRPRHEQISSWLRENLVHGSYKVNEQLPSESQLGDRFGVSRITIRRALQTLESEGLIYRRQGLGSFVKDYRLQQNLTRLTDFFEDMGKVGLKGNSKVLYQKAEEASQDIAEELGLPQKSEVIRLDRLRYGDGEIIAFDRTWLPAFYARLLEGHNLEERSIYSILEQEYQIPVLKGKYEIKAINATEEIAGYLNVSPGKALLLLNRVSETHGQKRIYYQKRYYLSERMVYELLLERQVKPQFSISQESKLRELEPVFKKSR